MTKATKTNLTKDSSCERTSENDDIVVSMTSTIVTIENIYSKYVEGMDRTEPK